MTIPVNDRRIQYTATAGQTIFPYDFKIDADTEIKVLQTVDATGITSELTLTTEYTVSGVGSPSGGDITLVTGAAVDDIITITGNTPLSRVTDFNQAGDFLMSDLNNQLDKITSILQEENTSSDRSVKLKDEDTASSLSIPVTSDRASKFLAFDATGNAIAAAGTTGVIVSSFMETVLDDTDAAAARATLDAEQITNSLTAITTLEDADEFVVSDDSDSGTSKKITFSDFKTQLPTASESDAGIAEIATQAEVDAGTDDTRFVTPLKLKTNVNLSRVLLSTAIASNDTTIDFESLMDSTYLNYEIELTDVIPASNGVLKLRLGIGASYATSGYKGGSANGTVVDNVTGNTSATTAIDLTSNASSGWWIQASSAKGLSGLITISNPSSVTTHKRVRKQTEYDNGAGHFTYHYGSGIYESSTAAHDSVRFFMSSGNISSGIFKLYGLK